MVEKTTWNILGRGGFGIVLHKEYSNSIWKFFQRDDGYEMFLKYVEKNPNVHFPLIISPIKKISLFHENENHTVSAVELEKLIEISSDEFESIMYDFKNNKNNSITNTIKKLYNEMKFDIEELKRKNIMKRKNGVYVLIDPHAIYTYEKISKKLRRDLEQNIIDNIDKIIYENFEK